MLTLRAHIYINIYKFAVPPILWSPKTKWNNQKLKTPQDRFLRPLKMDVVKIPKGVSRLVPKDGFQDFLQYVKSFIRRIHDQASGSQEMSSRLSLKNVFKASKALTLQTSWKLEFYTVSRQVFKTVYKRRLRDVESVNYRCVFKNGLTHDPKIDLKIIYKGRPRDVYSVNSSRMVLNTFSRWIFKPICVMDRLGNRKRYRFRCLQQWR